MYAPERPDLPMDERFEEACENLSYIEYLADYLTFADEEEGFNCKIHERNRLSGRFEISFRTS